MSGRNEGRMKERMEWADMEVPSESFCRSSWDSRTCYPWRTTNQGLTDDEWALVGWGNKPKIWWMIPVVGGIF